MLIFIPASLRRAKQRKSSRTNKRVGPGVSDNELCFKHYNRPYHNTITGNNARNVSATMSGTWGSQIEGRPAPACNPTGIHANIPGTESLRIISNADNPRERNNNDN